MKWFESFKSKYSETTKDKSTSSATSLSLVAFIISFAFAFGYLYFQQPQWVKYSEKFEEPVFSYRLTIVYSLLAASTVALLVFGYQYWILTRKSSRHSNNSIDSNDSKASKASKSSNASKSSKRY